jgi:hypothetical protein
MTVVNKDIAKRAIFIQEFRNIVETMNIFSEVATMLIATAKTIQSPFTSVTAAKAYTEASTVPVGTLTLSKNELVLDRKIGNAILDSEEELSYANFDLISMIRGDLYASIIKKMNVQAVADFVAGATVVAGTKDLSTTTLVQDFLIGIAATAETTVGLKSKIDGATVKRAPRQGKAFLACGATAYVNIVSKIVSVTAQSSLKGIDTNMIETPYGVVIINLGAAADNAKRLIWGTAGAPTMAYREDQVNVDMGEFTSTKLATANDLDVSIGDNQLTKTWYMSADTKGKNGIFSDVQSLVSTQLML